MTKRTYTKKLTKENVVKLDKFLNRKKPSTKKALMRLLHQFDIDAKFKTKPVRYMGYLQGVKLIVYGNGKRYTIPKSNFVYSIFK